MATKRKPVWDRPVPKKVAKRKTQHLTAQQREHAKRRAQRAGRNYPNLIDNIHEATDAKKKKSGARPAKKKRTAAKRRKAATTRKTAARRRKASRRPQKDPRGGLTAAGRAAFARREGSQLRPGVKKSIAQMTASEMKRKGSWAARFYGRSGKLPPLRDAHGRPTRFALTAAAWGEPVPKTVAQARAIAAKGRRLLERAKRRSSTQR